MVVCNCCVCWSRIKVEIHDIFQNPNQLIVQDQESPGMTMISLISSLEFRSKIFCLATVKVRYLLLDIYHQSLPTEI